MISLNHRWNKIALHNLFERHCLEVLVLYLSITDIDALNKLSIIIFFQKNIISLYFDAFNYNLYLYISKYFCFVNHVPFILWFERNKQNESVPN